MTYKTIHKAATAQITEKASKFIAYSYEVNAKDSVKQFLDQLKQEHPKATHICYAYRLGLDKNDYRVNDDGEPSNSAGRPILHAIDSLQLTNVLVAVVRYYGGTNLGIPGLIQTYKRAAKEALQVSGTMEKEVMLQQQVTINMLHYSNFRHAIKPYHVTISEEVFLNNQYEMKIEMPASMKEKIEQIIMNYKL